MPEQSNDYRVVVFGAGGVGKSSLVLRFIKGTFRDSYIPTIEDTYRQVGTYIENSMEEEKLIFPIVAHMPHMRSPVVSSKSGSVTSAQ
jgi:Ras-related protein Rap-1B